PGRRGPPVRDARDGPRPAHDSGGPRHMIQRTIDDAVATRLAGALLEAAERRVAIDPLTDSYPALTQADAYAIQEVVARRRREAGERVVGWKIGLTSAAMQQQLGVDQPDYGPLLTGHLVDGDAPVP